MRELGAVGRAAELRPKQRRIYGVKSSSGRAGGSSVPRKLSEACHGIAVGLAVVLLGLVGCTPMAGRFSDGQAPADMPMDAGMMARHMAPIPAEYEGLDNPVPGSEASMERGEAVYAQSCAVCHGEQGWGDGPAAAGLDPPPAPLAHTAGMLSDDYLFYRISEGGGYPPFNSAMPAFKEKLSENERWDTVNYVRQLSDQGAMTGGRMVGGGMNGGMGGDMMNGMMMGWMTLLGVLVLLLLVGGIALTAVVFSCRVGNGAASERLPGGNSYGGESPLDILKRRYASGEIDGEQFKQMKRDLEGS